MNRLRRIVLLLSFSLAAVVARTVIDGPELVGALTGALIVVLLICSLALRRRGRRLHRAMHVDHPDPARTAHLIRCEIGHTEPATVRSDMTNEEFVRQAYATAERKDIAAWVACFNPDGVFVDESVGVTYRGPSEVGKPVENYGTAFSDMHRELYDVYVTGDVVIVELALQGTHDGPLWLPQGILPPTGNRMDAPCCDVFRLQNGRIQLFDCYPSGTVILGQLGVLGNLGAVLQQQAAV
jgi:ketosteroid isomerase-like protein